MLKMFARHIKPSDIKYSQLKFITSFYWFLLLYVLVIFALSGLSLNIIKDMHLLLDVSNGILSLLLALFLLAEQSNIESNIRKYLAIGFGFAAATELLHTFAGITWLGWPAWIAGDANKLWPATWPPSTYVLPIALIWAIWLMRRNSALRPGVFAAGMAAVSTMLMILAFYIPQYFNTGLLGIQRPTQIPVLFLLLILIPVCWRERSRSPLFEGLAWMAVLLFLSDFFMLYSTSTLGEIALMAHAGKLLSYSFLHVIHMRLAAEDSRARKAAEAALLQETQHLRSVMNELVFQEYALDQHSIVGTTDVEGTIIYVNNSFCNISGYTREELIGKNHRLLNSGEHSTEFFREMYRTIAAGKVWKGEICNRAKDGHLYWVLTTIVPVLGDKGKPRKYISLRSEITERKRVESELIRYQDHLEDLVAEQILDLKQAKENAEAANRAKSEFLANMSHEIRTPMNGVVGVVEILQESQLTPAQNRMVHTIRTSSLALMGILGDILDISKIEAGKLELEIIPANLRDLVEGVAQLLAPTVADKDMDLIVFLPPDIPAWVSTDPGRVRQILFNLLSNAVKFTQSSSSRRGQVILRVGMKKTDGNDVLHFHIADNGIGMTQETITQLFRPFVQADASTTRRFGGTGLGLSISKYLAELLHGSIHVNSILGSGTEFTLELPLIIAPASHAPAVLPELSGLKVLIVTDNPVYSEILPAYLNTVCAQIKVVASQQSALIEINQSGEQDWEVLLDMTHESDIDPEIGNSIRKILPGLPIVPLVSRRISSAPKNELLVLANPLMLDDLVHTLALASRRIAITEIVQTSERRSLPRQVAPTIEEAVATGQLILVAEDNETNLEVIQEQLRILGYASEAAEDGLEALKKWRNGRGRYSLLFTDCHMPNLDGFGLTAAIRNEEPPGERLRIIAVTGNAMHGEAQRCLVNGMDDYLAKPLRLSDLGSKLAKWLPLKQVNVAPEPVQASQPARINADSPAAVDMAWDAGTLTRMVGDNPAMHRRLLDKFLLGSEEQVAAIMSAVAASDLETVVGVAHKMKSAARTVGAMRLGQLCQELESAGGAGDIAAVDLLMSELEIVFREAAVQIRNSYNK